MRTIFLLYTALFLSYHGYAQVVTKYALSQIKEKDGTEYRLLGYNDDLLLKTVEEQLWDGILLRDTLSYDASNHVVKINTHQFIDGVWRNVYYIDYTYDANGNLKTRANYNNFGGFELGGIYTYYYENNRLTYWELDMGDPSPVQVCNLTYNEAGQLIQEIGKAGFSGPLENSWKIEFQYNADGSLKKLLNYFWMTTSWALSSTELFTYDENQNCKIWEHKDGNTVTNKLVYGFNLDITNEQLILPVNPEWQRSVENFVVANNMVTVRHWYTIDQNTSQLVYITDYNYDYETINLTNVPEVESFVNSIRLFPNPSSDYITLSGQNAMVGSYEILDQSGKQLKIQSGLQNKETKINISDLKPGVYYLRVFNKGQLATERFIVK